MGTNGYTRLTLTVPAGNVIWIGPIRVERTERGLTVESPAFFPIVRGELLRGATVASMRETSGPFQRQEATRGVFVNVGPPERGLADAAQWVEFASDPSTRRVVSMLSGDVAYPRG